jgi:hypothetical protein
MKLPKKFKKRMDWIVTKVLKHNIFLTSKALNFLAHIQNYREIVNLLISDPQNEWSVIDIEIKED